MSDLNQLIKRLEEKKSALIAFHDKRWPARIGEIAISHFKRNFKDGGWNDNGLTRWKRTRRQEHGGKGSYYNRTPLLSGRNNLYGGFTYKTGSGRVTVENNVEYAPIHNTGGNRTAPDHPPDAQVRLASLVRIRRNHGRGQPGGPQAKGGRHERS